MNVFRRYRAVSREDLRTLVEAGNENGGLYLDVSPKRRLGKFKVFRVTYRINWCLGPDSNRHGANPEGF